MNFTAFHAFSLCHAVCIYHLSFPLCVWPFLWVYKMNERASDCLLPGFFLVFVCMHKSQCTLDGVQWFSVSFSLYHTEFRWMCVLFMWLRLLFFRRFILTLVHFLCHFPFGSIFTLVIALLSIPKSSGSALISAVSSARMQPPAAQKPSNHSFTSSRKKNECKKGEREWLQNPTLS